MSKKAISRKAAENVATATGSESFVVELNDNDVLMGRGSPSAEYSGNLRFRQLVIDRREDYLKCTRRNEKHRISMDIIDTIHQRGGRFLQRITTMQEADRLNVPPKTQAWKVVEKGSALYVKVKQLMRDVGEGTQQKRKIRREVKRKQSQQQSSSGGEDGASPKREKVAPLSLQPTASSSSAAENHLEDRKPTATVRFAQSLSDALQPPEPRDHAEHHSESGSSISTGGSVDDEPPDLAQYALEQSQNEASGEEENAPKSNTLQAETSTSLSNQRGSSVPVQASGRAGDTTASTAAAAPSQQFAPPFLNSRPAQSQQQSDILTILSFLQGSQAVAAPPPPPPQPASIEELLRSALSSQQQQQQQYSTILPNLSENTPNQQHFNQAPLELLALLLNTLQQGQQTPR